MVVTHQALRVVVFALMSLQKTCFSRKRSLETFLTCPLKSVEVEASIG